jgi:hypothetical protein
MEALYADVNAFLCSPRNIPDQCLPEFKKYIYLEEKSSTKMWHMFYIYSLATLLFLVYTQCN